MKRRKLTRKLQILLVISTLVAMSLFTAIPAYAAGGNVNVTFKPDVSGLGAADFTLYKVGEFNGPDLVLLDEYKASGAKVDILPPTDDSDQSAVEAWRSEWLSSADVLASYISSLGNKPEAAYGPVSIQPGTTGSLGYQDDGLYLLTGTTQRVGNENWTPVPVLILVNDGEADFTYDDVNVKMKSVPLVDQHMLRKVWDDKDHEALRPESIKVDILYGDQKVDTVVLSDENNWTYNWSSEEGDKVVYYNETSQETEVLNADNGYRYEFEAEAAAWNVSEVFTAEEKELWKFYTAEVENTAGSEGSPEVFTITNTYDTDELEITKVIEAFLDHEGSVSTAVVFDITGYVNNDGEEIVAYHNQVGTTFSAADSKVISVKNIPQRLDRIVVKEVYAANYRPSDGKYEKTALVDVSEDGRKYTVTFNNVFDDRIVYDGGVVNKYEIKDGQYKITERQGLTPESK